MSNHRNSTSAPEIYTVDDAMIDAGDLARQFQAAYDIIHEMDYTHQDGSRNDTLDHLASVMRVSLDRAKRLSSDIDTLPTWSAAPVAKANGTKAIQAKSFELVCDMEEPLTIIQDLLRMINIMCIGDGVFTEDRDACALQRTVWLAGDQLKKAESLRGNLFHMNHANQDGVEKREGV